MICGASYFPMCDIYERRSIADGVMYTFREENIENIISCYQIGIKESPFGGMPSYGDMEDEDFPTGPRLVMTLIENEEGFHVPRNVCLKQGLLGPLTLLETGQGQYRIHRQPQIQDWIYF